MVDEPMPSDDRSGRLARVRIVLGIGAAVVAPILSPSFARYRWLLVVYLAQAMVLQRFVNRAPFNRRLALGRGVVDVLALALGLHRLGLLSPISQTLLFMVPLLFALRLGRRGGLLMAAFTCIVFDVTMGLEAAGIVPYGADAPPSFHSGVTPTAANVLTVGILFPLLCLGTVNVVGRVVDGLEKARRVNRELAARPVFGHYQLERMIGQGGMGQVWEAVDRRNGSRVALKIVSPAAGTSLDARQRLVREARATLAIDHPNVVRVRDVFEIADGTPVMVMDLLVGETLADRLARQGRLSVADTARIALAIVSAMESAHALGIIHRDLKPENVFLQRVGREERVLVLDFGIAKMLGETDESARLTATGIIVGSPAYMAPEQAFGERALDHRVDIWALGIMLYECLAGVRPVDGENPGQVLRALMAAEMVPVEQVCLNVPPDIAQLVRKMLIRDRDARLADLAEVSQVLARHAGAAPSSPHAESERTTAAGPAPVDAPTLAMKRD
jgi:hypothetical protein